MIGGGRGGSWFIFSNAEVKMPGLIDWFIPEECHWREYEGL